MPTNEEQFILMMEQATPDLFEIRKLLASTQTDSMTIIKLLAMVQNVQSLSGWGKVTLLIQDKKPVKIEQEQSYKVL